MPAGAALLIPTNALKECFRQLAPARLAKWLKFLDYRSMTPIVPQSENTNGLSEIFPPPADQQYTMLLTRHIRNLTELQDHAIEVWRHQFRERIVSSVFVSVGGGIEEGVVNDRVIAEPMIDVRAELLEQFEEEIERFGKRVFKLMEHVVNRDDFLPPMP